MKNLQELYQERDALDAKRDAIDAKIAKAERLRELLEFAEETAPKEIPLTDGKVVIAMEYDCGKLTRIAIASDAENFDSYDVAKAVAEEPQEEPDPPVLHKTYNRQRAKKGEIAPKSLLRVKMADGTRIQCKSAAETFIRVIETIGAERVRSVGLKFCKVPIVSNTRDEKYGKAQHEASGGWLILTHSSTSAKKQQLDKIAKALGLNMEVEIISGKK